MSPTSPFLAPERDQQFKRGRGKQGSTSYYLIPGAQPTTTATISIAINTDVYHPLYVDTPIVVDQMAAEITSGGTGNMRIGLYEADLNWQPVGGPLMDSGNIDTSTTGVKTYTPGTAVYLRRGRYLSVYNSDLGPTLRIFRGSLPNGQLLTTLGTNANLKWMTVSRTYAAFPSPGTAWDTAVSGSNSYEYLSVFRVSVP